MECAKFKKIGSKNRVSLPHNNVLQHVDQWARFCMTKHFGVSIFGTLFHMSKSGQFYLNFRWGIPLRSTRMDVKRVASI